MGLFSTQFHAGLYFDSQTICVANCQMTGQTPKLIGFSELRTENNLDGTPEVKQKMVENIRASLRKAGVTSKNISLAVPGEGSMIRFFELPVLPKKEEKTAVRFEAQKYVPFDMKDLYFDYEVYPDQEKKRTGIVFFACKKKWVDSLTALLQLASIKVQRVELTSQAIARVFNLRFPKGEGQASIILAANNEETGELIIQKQGSVLTTRHLSLLGATTTTLQMQMDIPSLISDVRISMDYFNENFKKNQIEDFYLANPFPGNSEHLAAALKSEFSLQTHSEKILDTNPAYSCTAAMLAAYGLTLTAMEKKTAPKINLKAIETNISPIAPTLTWEEEKKQLNDLAVTEIIGLIIFFAVVYFVLSGMANTKKSQLDKITQKYPKAESASISDPLSQLQNKELEIQDKSASYTELVDKRVYFTAKMNALAKLVPESIQLQHLTYNDDVSLKGESTISLRLTGFVTTTEVGGELSAVNKFVAQLISDKGFMAGLNEIKIMSTQRTAFNAQPATKFVLDCATTRKN